MSACMHGWIDARVDDGCAWIDVDMCGLKF